MENITSTRRYIESKLRRVGGLPTSLLIQRSGDLFASKPERQTRMLAKVFEVRLTLCRHANLESDVVLPISMQKEGHTILFLDWTDSVAGKRKQQEVIWIKIINTPIIIT